MEKKNIILTVTFTSKFLRLYKKMYPDLQDQVDKVVEKFKHTENHSELKVHKLSGKLKNTYAFSVNYSVRIIFEYTNSKIVTILLTVGDHSIYEKFLKK